MKPETQSIPAPLHAQQNIRAGPHMTAYGQHLYNRDKRLLRNSPGPHLVQVGEALVRARLERAVAVQKL